MNDRVAVSVQQVADALGVSKYAIYRAIERGEIPARKMGTRVLIPRVWLEHYFDDATEVAS